MISKEEIPLEEKEKIYEEIEKPIRAFQIGVALIASSFLLGYPAMAVIGSFYGVKAGFYTYLATWVPLLLGFIIGGRPAYHAVKIYRHKMRRKLIESARGNAPGDDDEI